MRILDAAATSPLSHPASPVGEDRTKLEDAARQFEALLVAQLLKAARGDSEGWMGAGEDVAASSALELAEEQFAAALAAQGGLGLAGLIVSGLGDSRDPAAAPQQARARR